MYQFTDQIDYESLFVFDKRWIKNMNWAALPKASKAIFPVIMSHCDRNGLAFPSQRRIAILSGRTDKQVRKGVKGLEAFPGFKSSYRTTPRGKRGKQYHMKLPAIRKGATFPFLRCIIYGGNWSQLSPTAMALYPVIRHFSYFDFDMYVKASDLDAELFEFDKIYKDRDFDFCEADPVTLAEHAGIAPRSLRAARDSLQDNFLIEDNSEGTWKVFLLPPKRWVAAVLNEQNINRYQHEKNTGNSRKKLPQRWKKVLGS